MYIGYYESKFGVFEISASDKYLTKVALVKKSGNENLNDIVINTKNQLDLYFNKKLDKFDLPIEFNDTFKSRVLKALYETNIGDTLSYKQLGELVNSKAYRAVGTAMATNAHCIIIPCHRVIKSDGSVGNYFYGADMKKELILHEKQ